MTNQQKPIILQLEEGKSKLVQCVNEILAGGLNCYLIEPMFAEIYSQIKASAKAEVEQARKSVLEAEHTEQPHEGIE